MLMPPPNATATMPTGYLTAVDLLIDRLVDGYLGRRLPHRVGVFEHLDGVPVEIEPLPQHFARCARRGRGPRRRTNPGVFVMRCGDW